MVTSFRSFIAIFLTLWAAYITPAHADFFEDLFGKDQHDIPSIVSSLQSEIPAQMVAQARAFDDQLLKTGEHGGQKVYLITDQRTHRVNSIVGRLLKAMRQEDREWVVRVLDTHEPVVNAFVTGGKYIYVFTGLLKEADSDDEVAFILGHELGHSLLKQNLRRQGDSTVALANLALIVGALAKKEEIGAAGMAMQASYSQTDEEEADALGIVISWHAGFDPVRGVDFFSRAVRQLNEMREQEKEQLDGLKQNVEAKLAECNARVNAINQVRASGRDVKREYLYTTQQICEQAEKKRVTYNQVVKGYERGKQEQDLGAIFSSHPGHQSRVATIVALVDYIQGRRDLNSLQQFQQSYRVMSALKQIDSILIKAPRKAEVPPRKESEPHRGSDKSLTEKLDQLKQARDRGFITEQEYQSKRGQVLEGF